MFDAYRYSDTSKFVNYNVLTILHIHAKTRGKHFLQETVETPTATIPPQSPPTFSYVLEVCVPLASHAVEVCTQEINKEIQVFFSRGSFQPQTTLDKMYVFDVRG